MPETYLLPVIPTTGTFYIEETIGEKLDGCIESYKSISASHAKVLTDEMPYKWVTFKQYKRPKMYVNYDRQTYPLDSFTLPMIVELARKYDLGELWIHELILHLVDKRWKDRYYTFENKPISQGSDAERFIYNYYRKRKMNNWIETIPRRHLELSDVSGLEHYYWQDPRFIRFLNRRTHGLVLAKEVQKISDEKTVDLRILEKW